MAVDPDELLIFKARKLKVQEGASIKQESGHVPQQQSTARAIDGNAPAGARPQIDESLPMRYTKEPQRKMINYKEPSTSAEADEFGRQPANKRAGPITEEVAESPDYAISDRGFMARKIKVSGGTGAPDAQEFEPQAVVVRPQTQKKLDEKPITKKESRNEARGQFCLWHNWRPAYGICAICKRPYCYEDMVEYGGSLYCLEDITSAESAYKETVYMKYNRFSLVSAGLFILAFVLFAYFASGQISHIASYTMQNGLERAISGLGTDELYTVWGVIIAFAGFVVGLMVMLQLPEGFVVGIIDSLIAVALFTYNFLNTGTAYLGIVSALYFAAMVVLAYSRSAYQMEAENLDYLASANIIGT
jgi:hypothetical protein